MEGGRGFREEGVTTARVWGLTEAGGGLPVTSRRGLLKGCGSGGRALSGVLVWWGASALRVGPPGSGGAWIGCGFLGLAGGICSGMGFLYSGGSGVAPRGRVTLGERSLLHCMGCSFWGGQGSVVEVGLPARWILVQWEEHGWGMARVWLAPGGRRCGFP